MIERKVRISASKFEAHTSRIRLDEASEDVEAAAITDTPKGGVERVAEGERHWRDLLYSSSSHDQQLCAPDSKMWSSGSNDIRDSRLE